MKILNTKTALLTCFAALMVTAMPVYAEDSGDSAQMEQRTPKADLNKDGKVTKDEFVKAAEKRASERFDKMDTDNSGDISRKEAVTGRKEAHKEMKERAEKAKERASERKEKREAFEAGDE